MPRSTAYLDTLPAARPRRLPTRRPARAWALVWALGLVATAAAAPRQQPGDAREALELLRSPEAAERAVGERWLAARVGRTDFDAVADALREADVEPRERVVRALASDDRHLGLAARLAVDYDPPVARAGEAALVALAERFTTDDPGRPSDVLAGDEVTSKLVEGFTYSWSLALPAPSLDRAVDRLERVALGAELVFSRAAPVRLVLAPELLAEARELLPTRDPLTLRLPEGGFDRPSGPVAGLLDELRRYHGMRLEGFGFDGSAPWILVAPRGEVGRFTADELLARWCRLALQHSDRPLGEGAARALAAAGWPAAIAWLEERWLEAGDRNALSGLLVAAGRGNVAPGIATAQFVRDLLRRADDGLRAKDVVALAVATDIQRALASFGRLGAAGEDLLPALLAGFEAAPPAGRWLRLSVLESWRLTSPELRAELRAALLAPEGDWRDADLRLQALRTLAADPGADVEGEVPASPAAVWAAARTLGECELALEAFERLGLRPPASWRGAGTLAPFPRATHWIFEWWLASGELAVAAEHLSELLSSSDESTARLLERRLSRRAESGARDAVREVLDRARAQLEGTSGDAVERLDLVALEADCIDPEREAALLAKALADPGSDVLLLGALGGRRGGEAALERALSRLEAALEVAGPTGRPTRELQAVERALVGLRRAGLEVAAEEAQAAVRRLFREGEHPLYRYLLLGAWPPRPGLRPRELEALDPGLEEIWAGR